MRWLLLLLLFSCTAGTKYDLEGRVVKIADGDTFTMLGAGGESVRVRLHGVDCPERGQAFGPQAQAYLSRLIAGKRVGVEETDRDRYGRTVGIVHIGDTVVNEALLSAGLAWHYTEYDQNMEWARLQAEAKRRRNGLWKERRPVPPWQWRKAKRK